MEDVHIPPSVILFVLAGIITLIGWLVRSIISLGKSLTAVGVNQTNHLKHHEDEIKPLVKELVKATNKTAEDVAYIRGRMDDRNT